MVVQRGNSVRPQTKTQVISFKKTTNPNPSPTGKKFGFVTLGTIVLIGLGQKALKINGFCSQ